MNGEDVTQGTRYFNALREVADAARRVEHLRVQYENTLDQLTREKRLNRNLQHSYTHAVCNFRAAASSATA